MSKLFVRDIKAGVSKGGIACGPCFGHPVAEVCIHNVETNTRTYHCLVEVEDTLNFFVSTVSNYEAQIDEGYEDEALWDAINETAAGDYADYTEFFDEFYDLPMKEQTSEKNLIRKLLIALVRADWDETKRIQKMATNKKLETIRIPESDVEEEYLDGDDLGDDDGDFGDDEIEIDGVSYSKNLFSKEELMELGLYSPDDEEEE